MSVSTSTATRISDSDLEACSSSFASIISGRAGYGRDCGSVFGNRNRMDRGSDRGSGFRDGSLFLTILCYQVLGVVRAACVTSTATSPPHASPSCPSPAHPSASHFPIFTARASHPSSQSTSPALCFRVLDMVFTVIEALGLLDRAPNEIGVEGERGQRVIGETGNGNEDEKDEGGVGNNDKETGNDEGDNHIGKKRKNGDYNEATKQPNQQTSLKTTLISESLDSRSCVTEFLSAPHGLRLLLRALDVMDRGGMVTFSSVEYLLDRMCSVCGLGGVCGMGGVSGVGELEAVVKWVIRWFESDTKAHHDDTNRADGRKKCSATITLKSSFLLVNLFKTIPFLPSLSLSFSPAVLFKLSDHFLRTEQFEYLCRIEEALQASGTEEGMYYYAMMRTYAEVSVLTMSGVCGERGKDGDSHVSNNNDNNNTNSTEDSTNSNTNNIKNGNDNNINDNNHTHSHPTIRAYLRECPYTLCNVPDETLKKLQKKITAKENMKNGMKRMQSVDFSSCVPPGVSLPLSLSLLSDITADLNISKNFLTSLPPWIQFYSKLLKLNISGNSLKVLPEGMHSWLSNLKSLDLSDNALSAFPTTILNLKKLEELRLSGNNLEYIPMQISDLTKLQYLDISDNRLKALNSNLSHLRFLKT